ncbi:predicted protein [Nematostella vectensis]|uniref:Uncharacterized protein n=1 Tax=Nematostella vectensis TaxID=45351 RepID=A7REQ8_NEMVE|nr:predicted protein [Nematostella vectensis]|eukprot:XP_001641896.1 predicted protein [Nematostella vectensis]
MQEKDGSSSPASSEDSDVQAQLQSVLVTVKIQEHGKQNMEKRVRFNSLVEVRFIPKVRSKKRQNKNKEDEEKKKENTESDGDGEKTEHDENKEGEKVECEECCRKKKEQQEAKENVETVVTTTNGKAQPSASTSASKHKVFPSAEVKVNIIQRQDYNTPKVTIGDNYEGSVLRTNKQVKPSIQHKVASHRGLHYRRCKEARMRGLLGSQTTHLSEWQGICKEADTLLSEYRGIENHENEEKTQEDLQNCQDETRKNPTIAKKNIELTELKLYKSLGLPELASGILERKTSPVAPTMVKEPQESPQKLSTSLPYIQMPGVTGKNRNDTATRDSYAKLYLPQLQRREEDIKRLNETVLRKKAKYSAEKHQSQMPASPISPTNNGSTVTEKNVSPSGATSQSILRYSYGLDIARFLNGSSATHLFH